MQEQWPVLLSNDQHRLDHCEQIIVLWVSSVFHRLANSGGGDRTFASMCCVVTAAVFLRPSLPKAGKRLKGVLQNCLSFSGRRGLPWKGCDIPCFLRVTAGRGQLPVLIQQQSQLRLFTCYYCANTVCVERNATTCIAEVQCH